MSSYINSLQFAYYFKARFVPHKGAKQVTIIKFADKTNASFRTSIQKEKHWGRRLQLILMTKEALLILQTMNRLEQFPIELPFSRRYMWKYLHLITKVMFIPPCMHDTLITKIRTHLFFLLQGLGRLFKCLCNPAFDVDDEEMVYKSKWLIWT